MHKMMQAAIAQAHKAKQLGEIPVGAVVVRDERSSEPAIIKRSL